MREISKISYTKIYYRITPFFPRHVRSSCMEFRNLKYLRSQKSDHNFYTIRPLTPAYTKDFCTGKFLNTLTWSLKRMEPSFEKFGVLLVVRLLELRDGTWSAMSSYRTHTVLYCHRVLSNLVCLQSTHRLPEAPYTRTSFSHRAWRRDSPVCTHTKFSLVRLV